MRIDENEKDHFSVWVRHQRALLRYTQLLLKKRERKSYVVYLHGKPGTGKYCMALDIEKTFCERGE